MDEICIAFLQFRDNIKLFHFQTKSYAAHKASDVLEVKFSALLDRFMEVLQGSYNMRVGISRAVIHLDNHTRNIESYAASMVQYIASISTDLAVRHDDLVNILADMSAEIEQFIYLLTFDE